MTKDVADDFWLRSGIDLACCMTVAKHVSADPSGDDAGGAGVLSCLVPQNARTDRPMG
jgi:hypothetical protein